MRDHTPLVLDNFRGLFDRGEDEVCPPGFFINSLNWEFLKGGIQTRGGAVDDDVSPLIPALSWMRVELYERTGEAQRLLLLDSVGRLWDSVTGIVILSIPTMTDFSCTVMFDRAYITPHNGKTGLPGEKVYLYEGSGVARPAAGVGPPPSPAITVVESTLSGKIEKGMHWYGVAFESTSGYLSQLGAYATFISIGDKAVDISNIPLGPAGTTARVLFATKLVETIGNPTAETWYTIAEGRIPDNTTTIKTVSFYDADLMEDSSYLLEQLSEIPAGVGIGQYKGRLIVYGENANPAIIRLSQPGEPENHNGADGYVTVYTGIGGGVKNCTEYRNQLVIFKSNRTYSTYDNDDVPGTWDTGEVDGSVGTESHGIGQILNIGSNVEDMLFVSDKAGLRIFLGTFTDDGIITYNVDDIWGRITKTAFHNVEVSVDAINAFIYISLPLDGATTPTHILYGDYSEGLGEESIRWSLWKFPVRPTSIVISLVNGIPVLKFVSLDSKIAKIEEDAVLDFNQIIENFCKFPLFPVGDSPEQINHYTGIMLRARGLGVIDVKLAGLDDAETLQAQSLVLAEKPGKPYFKGFNFTSEHCSITLTLSTPGGYMIMTKFILYMSGVCESRPQVI